jgi:hypothetical protein
MAPVSIALMPPPFSSSSRGVQLARPPSAGPLSPTALLSTPSSGAGLSFGPDSQESSTAQFRDGRIRNPVPSKLKGKTDGSKGNFAVMLMNVGACEPGARDAEARRTSESTELAAKRATENGYVSVRRSRVVYRPDTPLAKPVSTVLPPQTTRSTPLSPEETKAEQTRLLTLLKTLNPVLVVDPESAEANGPGNLFVGWIAEIFPRLGGNPGQEVSVPQRHLVAPQPPKRKRGRPRGSKSTKARKDKGIKKGPKRRSDEPPGGNEADASITPLPQGPASQSEPAVASRQPAAPGSLTLPVTNWATSVASTPGTRKRGRPKGSRNRPKQPSAITSHTPSEPSQAGGQTTQNSQPPAQVPQPSQISQSDQSTKESTGQPSPPLGSSRPTTAAQTRAGTRVDGRFEAEQPLKINDFGAPGLLEKQSIDHAADADGPSPLQGQPPRHFGQQTLQPLRGQTSMPPSVLMNTSTPSETQGRPEQKRKMAVNISHRILPNILVRQDDSVTQPDKGPGYLLPAASEPPSKRQKKSLHQRNPFGSVPPRKTCVSFGPGSRSVAPLISRSTSDSGQDPRLSTLPGPSDATMVGGPASPSVIVARQSQPGAQSPRVSAPRPQAYDRLDQQVEVESGALTVQADVGAEQPKDNTFHLRNKMQLDPKQQQLGPGMQQDQSDSPLTGHGPSPSQKQQRSTLLQKGALSAAELQTRPPQDIPKDDAASNYTPQKQQHQHHSPPLRDASLRTETTQQSPKSRFPGVQNAQNTQLALAQQYSSNKLSYIANPQQYATGQQTLGAQSRYTHNLAATHPSPPPGVGTKSTFQIANEAYAGSGSTSNNHIYNQHGQLGTQQFRAHQPRGLTPRTPSFGMGPVGLFQRTVAISQTSAHTGHHSLASVPALTRSSPSEWTLFDTSQLDTSGQQGAMGLADTGYGARAGNNRTARAGPTFAANTLASFDSPNLGEVERYYGIEKK